MHEDIVSLLQIDKTRFLIGHAFHYVSVFDINSGQVL